MSDVAIREVDIHPTSKSPLADRRSGFRAILNRLRQFRYRYECPFCGVHLKRFLPFGLKFAVLREKQIVGGGYRENARCPSCGCIDRERLLYLYLRNETKLFEQPVRLLHVAPEARVAEVLHKLSHIEYVTADISGANVMTTMDITRIQFADDSFDAIICNHVLEHIIDDARAMSELHRVLKPGGWAILQVPISRLLDRTYEDFSIADTAAREAAFGQGDHVRIYGKDYPARLARAGFAVRIFQWTTRPDRFGGSRNRFGLNRDEFVFVGWKAGRTERTGGPAERDQLA